VFYEECSYRQWQFRPRVCLVDMEPGVLNQIKASPMSDMFKPDNYCYGASGCNNNWATGHYTEGAEVIDEVVDIIRREAESCDCPQAFQIFHSIGGGTGGGMGTLALLKIRDNYPDRINCSFTVFPSPKVSDVVVEPYNATLSIHQILQNTDLSFVIDNESLFRIAHNVLKWRSPKFADLNWVISEYISGATSSLRFSGKLNSDLRKMSVNLIPFPRLHFLLLAQAPLFSPGQGFKVKLTGQEITDQIWWSRYHLADVQWENGKYLSACCIYRGGIASQEIDDELAKVQMKMSDNFVSWIPNNIQSSLINVPTEGTPMSVSMAANTTAIKNVFIRILNDFRKLYKRGAFLHSYTGEGMDRMEFDEADKNAQDLITEYQDKQDVDCEIVYYDYDDTEDDEDEDDF